MAKSRVRRQYEYMAIGVPAAAGAGFLLAAGLHIYDPAGITFRATMAAPFVGGGIALSAVLVNEINRFTGAGRRVSQMTSTVSQPHWLDEAAPTRGEYIFRGRGLPVEIPESKLLRFCRIGCRRQEVYYTGDRTLMVSAQGFRQLSWNQVWAEAAFTDQRPRFQPADVKACKIILAMTGQFIRYGQGSAGEALGTNPVQLVARARRRWMPRPTRQPLRRNVWAFFTAS